MKTEEIIRIVDEICPPELAEEWDNCGWQVNPGRDETRRILTTLEVTGAVIDEACKADADMIITHHPMIFQGIKSININTILGKYICRLVNEGISVYACHTDFDKVTKGNNDYLGEILNLDHITALDDGFTRTGILRKPLKAADFVDYVRRGLGLNGLAVRWCGDPEKVISKAGWCTGAGFEFLSAAEEAGCDAFITGDVKYHEAREVSEGKRMVVVDAGHFGTEAGFGKNMAHILREKIGDEVEIIPAASIGDSFLY